MNDLISRQAAIERLTAEANAEGAYGYVDTKTIVGCLNGLPSAQPERRKGRWIFGICGECGYDWGKDAPISSVPNFCPNCGTDNRQHER